MSVEGWLGGPASRACGWGALLLPLDFMQPKSAPHAAHASSCLREAAQHREVTPSDARTLSRHVAGTPPPCRRHHHPSLEN